MPSLAQVAMAKAEALRAKEDMKNIRRRPIAKAKADTPVPKVPAGRKKRNSGKSDTQIAMEKAIALSTQQPALKPSRRRSLSPPKKLNKTPVARKGSSKTFKSDFRRKKRSLRGRTPEPVPKVESGDEEELDDDDDDDAVDELMDFEDNEMHVESLKEEAKPDGTDTSDTKVTRKWGIPSSFSFRFGILLLLVVLVTILFLLCRYSQEIFALPGIENAILSLPFTSATDKS